MTDDRKLNIAVLVKRFVRTGGAERYAVEVARRMVDRGHRVELYARIAEQELLSGITFHQAPDRLKFSSVLSSVAFASDISRMLDGKHHDVIHSHERGYSQDILTVHTFTYKNGVRRFSPFDRLHRVYLSPRSLMYLRLEKRQMRTPLLVPTGEVIKTDIRVNYNREEGVTTIIPGVDVEWFNPSWIASNRQRVRRRENIAEHETAVLFVGSEFRRKGLDYVIPAIRPDMRLLVVGNGQRLPHYRRMVKECGLQDRVHFKGLSSDVREYYAAADVVVLPSLREAFGMALLEGMACGLCVATTPNTGANALIEDGVNGFTAPDHSGLGKILERLKDPEIRKRMGIRARKTAEQYTWDHTADQYEQLYYQVAGR